MAQEVVQQVLGRAVTDAEFRQKLIDNAYTACEGYELTKDELEALDALDSSSLQTFAGTLDKRISKSAGKGFL